MMEFFDTETGHLIITGLFSVFTGGGLVNLYKTYRSGEDKEADDISALSYQFRKKLSSDLDKCKKETKDKNQKVLDLSVENAELKVINAELKAKLKAHGID